MGKELACRCLDELKAVAGSGKAGFLSILQSDLQESQDSTSHLKTNDTLIYTTENSDTYCNSAPRDDQSDPVESTLLLSAPATVPVSSSHMDENIFNPPQIQKMIVEHVVLNESTTSPSTQTTIRTFSGRVPKPNGEVDQDILHI